MNEPLESNVQPPILTLEKESLYYPNITPEQLLQDIDETQQPKARYVFFSNFHLRLIEPIYQQYYDKQFLSDLETAKLEGVKKYIQDSDISIEEAFLKQSRDKGLSENEYLVLAYMYISMRNKNYPRYDETKECLVK